MSDLCVSCRARASESNCGVCQGGVCRKCRIFLAAEEFPFAGERPADLKHTYYCGTCYDQKVAPFKADYEETCEKAKTVNIIFKGSKSTIRILRRAKKALELKGSEDRDQLVMKLAFEAVKAGFNAVIDVEIDSQKVRNEGWQTSAWSGRGVPAEIFSHELETR